MAVLFLARFLFGLALLAQAVSMPSAGFATRTSGEFAGSLRSLCVILHGEAKAPPIADAASEQAPKNDSAHRHGLCAFCEIGAGGPALHSRMGPISFRDFYQTHSIFAGYADTIAFFRSNRNAPARAPPSFA